MGTGYIDVIVIYEVAEDFIRELTDIGVMVEGVTWWCHCSPESEMSLGCPQGMGGPRSKYFEGWFSETQITMFETKRTDPQEVNDINFIRIVEDVNRQVIKHIKEEFPKSSDYLTCMMPGLWLDVPHEWKRVWNSKRW